MWSFFGYNDGFWNNTCVFRTSYASSCGRDAPGAETAEKLPLTPTGLHDDSEGGRFGTRSHLGGGGVVAAALARCGKPGRRM